MNGFLTKDSFANQNARFVSNVLFIISEALEEAIFLQGGYMNNIDNHHNGNIYSRHSIHDLDDDPEIATSKLKKSHANVVLKLEN